ncbi:hypothetical protein C1147_12835 [Clostridium botulinum]|nr:hypothetical protein C1147_12835 [Clostridium botulinum]RFM21952.1 hypothetical protein C1146_05630 [Clostridium botulinum]
MEEKINVHDIRLNDRSKRIDKIEQKQSRTDTKIENLCDQLKQLVSVLKWYIGLSVGALVSFFFMQSNTIFLNRKIGDYMKFLKQFLQIKKIIALFTTIVFCYLSIKGSLSSTEFLSVFTLIIGFYFGQSSARQAVKESKEQE